MRVRTFSPKVLSFEDSDQAYDVDLSHFMAGLPLSDGVSSGAQWVDDAGPPRDRRRNLVMPQAATGDLAAETNLMALTPSRGDWCREQQRRMRLALRVGEALGVAPEGGVG
ncbi:hypothetical protein [Streptomyces sp. NRRL S-337]|uniref:hypothetical protein n=1 Tax=Streptomyces sp. NRRL S-337 TaxID=1463900 RepID=UPI0004C5E22F|nr:hypothetical protein [Streptomyces sp. NRRL S-337]